mmetsp:Transcript_32995/g.74098  ORF Transcript_32995/g.74098 Transcript_32995/m.74098 type:complete len:225 (-) Transcript_32995:880-1554(-)
MRFHSIKGRHHGQANHVLQVQPVRVDVSNIFALLYLSVISHAVRSLLYTHLTSWDMVYQQRYIEFPARGSAVLSLLHFDHNVTLAPPVFPLICLPSLSSSLIVSSRREARQDFVCRFAQVVCGPFSFPPLFDFADTPCSNIVKWPCRISLSKPVSFSEVDCFLPSSLKVVSDHQFFQSSISSPHFHDFFAKPGFRFQFSACIDAADQLLTATSCCPVVTCSAVL